MSLRCHRPGIPFAFLPCWVPCFCIPAFFFLGLLCDSAEMKEHVKHHHTQNYFLFTSLENYHIWQKGEALVKTAREGNDLESLVGKHRFYLKYRETHLCFFCLLYVLNQNNNYSVICAPKVNCPGTGVLTESKKKWHKKINLISLKLTETNGFQHDYNYMFPSPKKSSS